MLKNSHKNRLEPSCPAHIYTYRQRRKDGDNDRCSNQRECEILAHRSCIRQISNSRYHMRDRIDLRQPLKPIRHRLDRYKSVREKGQRKQDQHRDSLHAGCRSSHHTKESENPADRPRTSNHKKGGDHNVP